MGLNTATVWQMPPANVPPSGKERLAKKKVVIERPAAFGFGISGLAGMAQMFLGSFGFNIPIPPQLIAFMMWMCLLSPCWLLGCILFAPCCCRKKKCCCWGTGLCGCSCCHSHIEDRVVKLQRMASEKLSPGGAIEPVTKSSNEIEMVKNPNPNPAIESGLAS